MMRLVVSVLLAAIVLETVTVWQVNCNPFGAITKAITGHGDENEEKEKKKEEHESLYEGGIVKQAVHSTADVVLDRAIAAGTEETPRLIRPAVEKVASHIKKEVHEAINEYGEADKKEEEPKEKKEEEHEGIMGKITGMFGGGGGDHEQEHRDHEQGHRDNKHREEGEESPTRFGGDENEHRQEGEEKEGAKKKEGLLDRFKDAIHIGHKDHVEWKERRKRSLGQDETTGQLGARQSNLSKFLTRTKSLITGNKVSEHQPRVTVVKRETHEANGDGTLLSRLANQAKRGMAKLHRSDSGDKNNQVEYEKLAKRNDDNHNNELPQYHLGDDLDIWVCFDMDDWIFCAPPTLL